MRRLALFMLCCLYLLSAHAEVYKWFGSDGAVHFSDQPYPGAEKVEISPVQIVPAIRASGRGKAQQSGAAAGYDGFAFITPGNEQVIRSNDGTVNISMALEPPLRSGNGDRVTVKLDGVAMRGPAPMSFKYPGLDRGTHTLQAIVVDANGKQLIQTDTVTFHLFRHHK